MILGGKKAAIIRHVQLIDIHGTRYYDIAYSHANEEQMRTARLGPEAVYAEVQPGDQVQVSYMMGVATGVERYDA